jgi:RNA polymerase sigma-70 factor (ECF subfamily)
VTVALVDRENRTDAVAPPAELEDERLVRALRRGDAAAFETLYRRHCAVLYGLAFNLTRRASEAEELTQETFVRAWQHRDGFRSVAHFGRWLKRVAVNEWISRLRRDVVAARLGDDDPPVDLSDGGPVTPAGAPGLALDLARAVAALPPRLRAVLLLFDLYGLRHDEIAAALEMTPGACKVQLHRARSRMREMLQ